MIVDAVSIQLYLRGIVLDFIKDNCPNGLWLYNPSRLGGESIPVHFITENTQGNSHENGILIAEHFEELQENAYTDFIASGALYYLEFMDDRGTGLRLKRFIQELQRMFEHGVHDVSDEVAIDITSVNKAEFESEADDSKIHMIMRVSANVFAK